VAVPWEWWRVLSLHIGRLRMPSVVGLLEQRELATHRRVDGPREEADRIQADSPRPSWSGRSG
jgi:hypothetical protein